MGGETDLITAQMSTLLEMLRAAKADDMAALNEAEDKANDNRRERKRLDKSKKKEEAAERGKGGGHRRDHRSGESTKESTRESTKESSGDKKLDESKKKKKKPSEEKGRRRKTFAGSGTTGAAASDSKEQHGSGSGSSRRPSPPTASESSSSDREPALPSAAGKLVQQPSVNALTSSRRSPRSSTPPLRSEGALTGGQEMKEMHQKVHQVHHQMHQQMWEDDSRDMTRMGDSTDLTRATAHSYLHQQDDEYDDDPLSQHTREEMGPPIDESKREEYYDNERNRSRGQSQSNQSYQEGSANPSGGATTNSHSRGEVASSTNVDADIQSRVLRQLENEDGQSYLNDDEDEEEDLYDDEDYYDSDESSEISDITSPTFATYADPPTVAGEDGGSIMGRRYARGRFAGMTAAQVAAMANRRVNDRHRADGKSVSSVDEKSDELERRLERDAHGTEVAPTTSEPSSLVRPSLDDRPPPPSLAGDLKPPSMRSMTSSQIKQDVLDKRRKEKEEEEERLRQQLEDEQLAIDEALAEEERRREELLREEEEEKERRKKAEQEEAAARRAVEEAKEKARARQQERRERQRKEMLERKEEERRREEEFLASQMQNAVMEHEQDEEEKVEIEADFDHEDQKPSPPQRQTRPPSRTSKPQPHMPNDDIAPNRRSSRAQGATNVQRRPAPTRRSTQSGPSSQIKRPDRTTRGQSNSSERTQQVRNVKPRSQQSKLRSSHPGGPSRDESAPSRGGIKRFSQVGGLRKAKAKFKASMAPSKTGADKSSPSNRKKRPAGRQGDDQGLLLSRSSSNDQPPSRRPTRPPQRERRHPGARKSTAAAAWKQPESAAWKQSITEKRVEKNRNPNQTDIDELTSTFANDVDYIFREISTFDNQQKSKAKPNDIHTGLPANPTPSNNDPDSDDESLIATAKIKYSLGSIAKTLNQNEKGGGRRSGDKATASRSGADEPVMIDSDGFLISPIGNNSSEPAFDALGLSEGGGDDATPVKSEEQRVSPPSRRYTGSDLMEAKRRELLGESKPKPRERRRKSADMSKDLMALAAGKRTTARASIQRGDDAAVDDDSSGPIHSGLPTLEKGERNFSTIQHDDDDDDMSKIDAMEAATKRRIEMLRKAVAEKAVALSAVDGMKHGAGRASAHRAVVVSSDPDLESKVDLVEQETMKQISRLRKRYASTRQLK